MRRTVRNLMFLSAAILIAITASTRFYADTGTCGGASITLPFVDVPPSNVFFCSIAEAFLTGLTNGADATHYSPSTTVPREQMAAFVTRTLDQSLKRGSKRTAMRHLWNPQTVSNLGLTSIGANAVSVKADGADVWTANLGDGTVSRVRANNGKLLSTWTGATGARALLVALGKIFVTGFGAGKLYQIDPTQPAGAVTTLTSSLGNNAVSLTCDGARIWIANQGVVEIVSLNPTVVTSVSAGLSNVAGITFDGTNIWVTDIGDNTLKQLDSNGVVVKSISLGSGALPSEPVFDGSNIWVPNNGNSTVSVVRATGALAGTVLATLTGNGLSGPIQIAFDGERVLVTNFDGVSLWDATTLTPLGSFFSGNSIFPFSVCSDGLNFWFPVSTGSGRNKLARF